jgi:hypothetical protein
LGADAGKVALFDIVEDFRVSRWKARRLNVGVIEVEDRFALQGFLRQDEVDSIDKVKPRQFG